MEASGLSILANEIEVRRLAFRPIEHEKQKTCQPGSHVMLPGPLTTVKGEPRCLSRSPPEVALSGDSIHSTGGRLRARHVEQRPGADHGPQSGRRSADRPHALSLGPVWAGAVRGRELVVVRTASRDPTAGPAGLSVGGDRAFHATPPNSCSTSTACDCSWRTAGTGAGRFSGSTSRTP